MPVRFYGAQEMTVLQRLRSLLTYWSLALGLFVFAFLVVAFGEDIVSQLTNLNAWGVLAFICVSLGQTLVWAVRWQVLAKALSGGHMVNVWTCLSAIWQTGLISQVLPREVADIGGRAVLLSRRSAMPIGSAAHSVFVDRVLDLVLLMVVIPSAIGLMWLPPTREAWLIIACASVGIGFFALALLLPAATWLLGVTAQRARRFFTWMTNRSNAPQQQGNIADDALPHTFTPVQRVNLAGLTVVKYGLLVTRAGCVAWAIETVIPASTLVSISPVGQASWALSFTPGGLGVYEAGWFLALVQFGALPAIAVAYITTQRVLILAAALLFFIPTVLLGSPARKTHPEK